MRIVGLALGFFVAGFAVADTGSPIDEIPTWVPSGGEVIAFDVLRKGKPFGRHVLQFKQDPDGRLIVVNDIDLTVRFGPITPFKYRHDSTETWSDGRLVELESKTLKDGDKFRVLAEKQDDDLVVRAGDLTGLASGEIIPSSHWNIEQIFSETILSTETGEIMPVVTEQIGREILEIDGATVETTRFRLSADLDVDLWYDDAGRWVKCAFEARGQSIEYVLTSLY